MKTLYTVAFVLLIVGGLNWLLEGLFSTWDLADYITDGGARLVYILVGISAIIELTKLKGKKSESPRQEGEQTQMNQPM